ncbi:MAG: hypothetical protein AAGI34_12585 [Pseudomonadota bacterium]
MATLLAIATTGGPSVVRGLYFEPVARRSQIVRYRQGHIPLGVDTHFHAFDERLRQQLRGLGFDIPEAPMLLEVDGEIDAGESWQLGLAAAHVLHALGDLVFDEAASERRLVVTGKLGVSAGSRPWEALGVGGVPEKLVTMADFLAGVAAERRLFVLPEANAGETAGAPEGLRMRPVADVPGLIEAVVPALARPRPAVREATPEAQPPKLQSPELQAPELQSPEPQPLEPQPPGRRRRRRGRVLAGTLGVTLIGGAVLIGAGRDGASDAERSQAPDEIAAVVEEPVRPPRPATRPDTRTVSEVRTDAPVPADPQPAREEAPATEIPPAETDKPAQDGTPVETPVEASPEEAATEAAETTAVAEPDGAAPENSAPESSASENVTPENATPENAAPEEPVQVEETTQLVEPVQLGEPAQPAETARQNVTPAPAPLPPQILQKTFDSGRGGCKAVRAGIEFGAALDYTLIPLAPGAREIAGSFNNPLCGLRVRAPGQTLTGSLDPEPPGSRLVTGPGGGLEIDLGPTPPRRAITLTLSVGSGESALTYTYTLRP